MEDRLREMLMRTDAAIRSPVAGDLVGGAIRRRAQRHRRVAIIGMTCMSVLVAIVTHHGRRVAPSPSRMGEEWVQGFSVADQARLDLASRTVNDLLLAERKTAAEDHLQRLESQWIDIKQQRDEAAVAVLEQAADLTDGRQVAAYRQVVQSFPDTGAAVIARQRLAAIQ
jgi:hypothetical protein